MRRWLHRNLGGPVPRPMPILLEDLYPPPARAVYRGVRAWEQNLVAAIDRLDGAPEEVGIDVRLLARACRRHLLLVQRLRFEITSHRDGAEADPRYDLWVKHRVGWSGELAHGLEQLALASRPFLDAGPVSRADVRALVTTMRQLQHDIECRNGEIRPVL